MAINSECDQELIYAKQNIQRKINKYHPNENIIGHLNYN